MAMKWSVHYLETLWGLLGELWAYFVIGFLVAGVIAEFVPRARLLRYFGENTVATFLRATFAGIVASLCSCGAIPVAAGLRKQGASKAAALTFLLAAPWAGFMQVLIFQKFLGWLGTAVMFVSALAVAFLSGLILGRLEDRGWLEDAKKPGNPASRGNGEPTAVPWSCGDACSRRSLPQRAFHALREAGAAFSELWKFLAFGLLIAAALKAFVPSEWVARFLGRDAPFNPVLTAIPLAAAVELCSEGFSIFAGQLHAMGATLAVVFIVVMVGVATDFTELSVIWGRFGKRATVTYLLTATTLALAFALTIQRIFG